MNDIFLSYDRNDRARAQKFATEFGAKAAASLDALSDGRFGRWFVNSIAIATIVTVSNVFFDSLVGYTLAKFRFRGRSVVFVTHPTDASTPICA